MDLSLIIPCYNSADTIESRVQEFETVLKNQSGSWEILLCDDASSDESAAICRRLADQSASRRFISSPINRGLGQNVAAGITASQGKIVAYADADHSTSAFTLPLLVQALENGYDIAETHRIYHLPLSTLPFIAHRFLAHHIYAGLVNRVLGLQGHDTVAGFKVYRREAALRLLDMTRATDWFWDTEMIANAHQVGYRVAEIPARFVRRPRMPTGVRLIPDSLKLFQQLRRYARANGRSLRQSCCRPAPSFSSLQELS